MNKEPISDGDLCGYADRRLDPDATQRVGAQIAADPRLGTQVADWRAQDEALHALFDPVVDEATPQRLIDAVTAGAPPARSRWPLRHAAAVGWLALGLVIGYAVRGGGDQLPATIAATPLARQAAIAHAVYVPEVRHPVEVGADQEGHLLGWLSKRLGTQVHAPKLEQAGFALIGGRLLPSDSGPGAQLMYQDATGQRLTLYLAHSDEHGSTAFRFAEEDGLGVFYWVDGGTGYALSGTLPRDRLLTVATLVYQQLNP